MVRKWKYAVTVLGVCVAAWGMACAEVPREGSIEFRIRAPTMVAALIQFSQQSGLQLLLPTDNESVQQKAPVIEGIYAPRDALEALLRDSGFSYTFVNARTVSIFMAPAPSGSAKAHNAAANQ